jgi:hypothetical protein
MQIPLKVVVLRGGGSITLGIETEGKRVIGRGTAVGNARRHKKGVCRLEQPDERGSLCGCDPKCRLAQMSSVNHNVWRRDGGRVANHQSLGRLPQ